MDKHGMDIEDLEDDELDELEDFDEDDEDIIEEEKPKKKKKKLLSKKKSKSPPAPLKKKVRYATFSTPARAGVVDAETGEVVGEGELGIYTILAKIMEKIETMDKKIGDILDG